MEIEMSEIFPQNAKTDAEKASADVSPVKQPDPIQLSIEELVSNIDDDNEIVRLLALLQKKQKQKDDEKKWGKSIKARKVVPDLKASDIQPPEDGEFFEKEKIELIKLYHILASEIKLPDDPHDRESEKRALIQLYKIEIGEDKPSPKDTPKVKVGTYFEALNFTGDVWYSYGQKGPRPLWLSKAIGGLEKTDPKSIKYHAEHWRESTSEDDIEVAKKKAEAAAKSAAKAPKPATS